MIYTNNWVGVVVAVVVNFVLGWLWYGMVFKDAWVRLSGHSMQSMDEMKQSGATPMRGYIVNIILGIITPFVFFSLAESLGLFDFSEALMLGFWIWFGFMVPISVGDVIWGGKSWKLFALNAGNLLASVVVMSLVYAWMG